MVVEPVDKCPLSYEPYEFTLSERYRQMAKEELGENEATREQALATLRDWIAKHPYIRKCRTDARFLLRFLRFRKFSIPGAQKSIERYLVTRQRLAEWYQNLDPRDAAMRKFTDDLAVCVLGKDSAGRTVTLVRAGRIDVDQLTPQHLFRYGCMIGEYLVDHDESVQIAGLSGMVDYAGVPLKFFTSWGMTEIKISTEAYTKVIPFRYGPAILAGLPSVANALGNLVLSMLDPELKQMVSFHPTSLEARKHIDENLWIKEYGGTLDMETLSQQLAISLDGARDRLLGLDQMEIDIEHYSENWNMDEGGCIGRGLNGSFRKLEID